jgi:hypothetical protein
MKRRLTISGKVWWNLYARIKLAQQPRGQSFDSILNGGVEATTNVAIMVPK